MEDNKRIYESMSSDEISAAYNSLEGKSELVKKEVAELRGLKNEGFWKRTKWYFSKSGPGWMQSAMTLGGGSAMASLFSGAHAHLSADKRKGKSPPS